MSICVLGTYADYRIILNLTRPFYVHTAEVNDTKARPPCKGSREFVNSIELFSICLVLPINLSSS